MKTFQEILNDELRRQDIASDAFARQANKAGANFKGRSVREWQSGDALPRMEHGAVLSRLLRVPPAKLLKAAELQARLNDRRAA